MQKPVLDEYQTMGGCFGHARILACFASDGYINRFAKNASENTISQNNFDSMGLR
jgi:hypothetical protein